MSEAPLGSEEAVDEVNRFHSASITKVDHLMLPSCKVPGNMPDRLRAARVAATRGAFLSLTPHPQGSHRLKRSNSGMVAGHSRLANGQSGTQMAILEAARTLV